MGVLFLCTIVGGIYFATLSLPVSNHLITENVTPVEVTKTEEEKIYEACIKAIEEKDYVTATARLKKLVTKDNLPNSITNAKHVYMYAQSQLYYNNGNKAEAVELLKEIPDEYQGDFSDEISVLRDLLMKTASSHSDSHLNDASSNNEKANPTLPDSINRENIVQQKISQIKDDMSSRNDEFERDYSMAMGHRNTKQVQYELEMQNAQYLIRKYREIIELLKSTTFEREDVRLSQIDLHEKLIKIQESRYNRALNSRYGEQQQCREASTG